MKLTLSYFCQTFWLRKTSVLVVSRQFHNRFDFWLNFLNLWIYFVFCSFMKKFDFSTQNDWSRTFFLDVFGNFKTFYHLFQGPTFLSNDLTENSNFSKLHKIFQTVSRKIQISSNSTRFSRRFHRKWEFLQTQEAFSDGFTENMTYDSSRLFWNVLSDGFTENKMDSDLSC